MASSDMAPARVLWQPEQPEKSNMYRFMQQVARKRGLKLAVSRIINSIA